MRNMAMVVRFCLVVALAALAAAASAAAQTGSVEWVARVTPSAGRAEPALRLPFFLLRKSFQQTQKEAEESEPRRDLDSFVGELSVSNELKEWMKRSRWVQLSGSEFMRRVKVSDVFGVPEFFEAYLARNAGDVLFPTPKYQERDREQKPQKYERQKREYHERLRKFLQANPHTLAGIEVQLTEIDPGQRWAREESERRRRIRQRALELAQTRYLVAKAETDLEGRAALTGVPPGDYWLSTLEAEATAGDVRLRWDTPVTVRAGRMSRLELSNFNAVSAQRSEK